MSKGFKSYQKTYLDQFLSLKCSGDVLNVVAPINRAQKEISESMAVVNRLRSVALRDPMEGVLIDLCAGNALTSVIAAHLLPFRQVFAVDIKKRKRDWRKVKRFEYIQKDIRNLTLPIRIANTPAITIISIHPCGALAEEVIKYWKKISTIPLKSNLILVPCCKGHIKVQIPSCFDKKLTKYDRWAWYLSDFAGGRLSFDNKVLSPCNAIIEA